MLFNAVYPPFASMSQFCPLFCFQVERLKSKDTHLKPRGFSLQAASPPSSLRCFPLESINFPGGLWLLSSCSSCKLPQKHPVHSLPPVTVFLRISYYRVCYSWHALPVTPATTELNLLHALAMNCSLKSITKLCMVLEFSRSWGQRLGMVDPATLSVMTGGKF